MNKQSNAIFTFTPRRSTRLIESLEDLTFQPDFGNFIRENKGETLTVTIEHTASKTEKTRMYRYLNGPLIGAVMSAKRAIGDPKDKVECMIEMKCLFAKDIRVINGESHVVLMSQSDMTKQQLLNFIKDIIMHLESEYHWTAPDSEEYLINV